MFSDLALRLSRTQLPCASNDFQKQQPTLRRRDNPMLTNPRESSRGERNSRESSGRRAYAKETYLTIVAAQVNTGETTCSSSIQRRRETSIATNPRENSRGERNSRETSGRRAYAKETYPTIVAAQVNTRETTCSSSIQRRRETSIATNRRENSRGERNSRETSGRLAYIGEIPPTIVTAEENIRETSGSSSVQCQRETSIATNSRENSLRNAIP